MVIYGLWHKGISPGRWTPDFEECNEEEISRWERDLTKDSKEDGRLEGYYGIGVYEQSDHKA